MNQFRGTAGCATGKIGLFHKCHTQPAKDGVSGDARTENAAANYDEIPGFAGELRQLSLWHA
jgi:hypothetical protein